MFTLCSHCGEILSLDRSNHGPGGYLGYANSTLCPNTDHEHTPALDEDGEPVEA